MGKKRKASGQPVYDSEPRQSSASDSKLRVNTFEDVADSEDEFHINRDKVLLEEAPLQKRRRKVREEDEYLDFSDEEVLSASPSIGESEEQVEEDQRSANEDKRFQSSKSTKDAALDSDTGNSRAPSEDEDIGEWGSSKKDYYNADIIETEADALEEEAEARRLQRKYLQGMTEADFGFDEANWLDNDKDAQWDPKQEVEQHDGVVSQILPQQDITDAMGPDERLQILRTRYPEFEPLAKEFLDLQSLHDDLNLAAKSATVARSTPNSGDNISEGKLPIAAVKHSALSAYLAALAMYFALLTSQRTVSISTTASMSPNELRDHPIMASLVQLRGLWGKVKDIPIPDVMTINTASSVLKKMPKDDEVDTTSGLDAVTTKTKPRKRKSKLERAVARAQEEANTRRLERLQETEASLASLSDLTKVASKPVKVAPRPAEREDDSDFGDPTHLAAHEAAQKEARKKSLKFYTSQIVSKSQKRGAAGRDAGGDADLPYKERLRDRQERLNAQAEKRGKKNKPSEEEALGGESDEEDARAAREIRDGGEEDYYDLIANKTSTKKVEKARLAAEQAAAVGGLVRIPDDEMDGEDGKRAISYAIEKNKGLHPKRKKEVRNPRVKKRKKYEEKKKRLGSVRQVYKGGEGKGYQGEMTGIKGNLVRSVKL